MAAAVTAKDLTKTFGEFRAVDGVSLDAPEGDIVGLLGPNGAGKTTTIRMMLDIIRPDSGEIRIFGEKLDESVKNNVGYLPEERGLYRKMKVSEMLEFHGTLKGMSIARARKTADEWLERLELGSWKTKKVEELSKGMQQKVQFIAAVLHRPRLLILDEPFSGMDPVNQDLFKDVILDLNRGGTTILFSTHQMETAERLCRHIVLINGGKVVLSGLLASIKMGFGKNSVQMEFDGDGAFLRTLPGVVDVDDYGQYSEILLDPSTSPQALLQTVVGRLRIRRFEQVSPSLHNIFIELVKGERVNA